MSLKHWAILLCLLLLSTTLVEAQTVTGTDFPFARFTLKTPPMENAYPGLGNYYSALTLGLDTVMWNPASLSKVKYASGNISVDSGSQAYEYAKTYEIEDGSFNLRNQSEFSMGFYLTDDETVTTPATREHTAHNFYQTQGTGIMIYKNGDKYDGKWYR